MSAVPVTLVGTFTQDNGQTYNGTFQGLAVITGLGVGGGPIMPPPTSPGKPTHPIVLPGDPSWGDPHPAHPIVLPDPPTEIPPNPDNPPAGSIVKPPPPEGGWAWSPEFGWGYYPGTGNPGPKK